MHRLRITPIALACLSVLALTGCGGTDAETPAAPAASATMASPTAPSATSSPSASPAATAAAVSDKKLCEAAKKASADMKAALVDALSSGQEPSPALFREILTGLENEVKAVAATGDAGSSVTAALTSFGAEAGKAAAAADPGTAADNPAFGKAGARLTAACRKAGVNATF
ncbi:hypothetical protein [Micromonospora sp. NPDC126480]|uniref:hypothetical protein n=1 Tax=Micromonospora sp. NPDC126480 TaxID=3155312 RepID=UPI003316C76F